MHPPLSFKASQHFAMFAPGTFFVYNKILQNQLKPPLYLSFLPKNSPVLKFVFFIPRHIFIILPHVFVSINNIYYFRVCKIYLRMCHSATLFFSQ